MIHINKEKNIMKKYLCLAPLCLVAFTGCSQAEVDTTPVWSQQLPQTGVRMELSNCELLGTEAVDYTLDRDSRDPWVKKPALQTKGIPVVTLQGASQDEVELRFVENIDTLYLYYDKMMPQVDLDYIVTELDDGSLQYRLDTVYNFEFVVTTENGTDTMIVTCQRDGITDTK
ncbi:hypothetical protein SUBVAR_05105 [Subdoligranulum variabile DSM 15176]|uniref:Uncharacterized protein n=2 Tax=Subdoligranulum variabile TaxID=214851 RepID=D1PL67_9FIRM|nr:hypothetical protein SUBVAR_05105 [Subdoligranulum variabile DSM 15176]